MRIWKWTWNIGAVIALATCAFGQSREPKWTDLNHPEVVGDLVYHANMGWECPPGTWANYGTTNVWMGGTTDARPPKPSCDPINTAGVIIGDGGPSKLVGMTVISSSPSGSATTTILSSDTSSVPPVVHEFERFTQQEKSEIESAHKHLKEVEGRIRSSHGESVRGFTNGSTTADCRASQTVVEIMDDGVLKTTMHAGVGDNPTCF